MTILVRNALIKDIHSTFHNKSVDLLISNGIITEIAQNIKAKADHIIEFEHLHVSPGWVDLFVSGTDPGYEHKDSLHSLAAASAQGGFTHVLLTPNSKPVVQNKTGVHYITDHQHAFPVNLHPIGAITKNTEGKELTEMVEMKTTGALAFSDGSKPVQSSGLMIKALQYVKAFNGLIIQLPEDQSVAPNGQMNEGIVSTQIGLPGKPALSEDIMVSRDIELAQYTDSKLHLTGVTTQKSIDTIRKAKQAGINVTVSATPHHLYFAETDLIDYDTNLKVNPPLRTNSERLSLIESVKKGDIDCISSHHTGQNLDLKNCEFEYAGAGMVGLESAFGVLGILNIDIDKILELICMNPRKIMNLTHSIEVGSTADLTLFNPAIEYEFSPADIKSKSSNTPFIGKKLKGKVLGTILNNNIHLS